MKRLIAILMAMMLTLAMWSWELVEQEDAFGDPTGSVVLSQMIENGKFSNSASTNAGLYGFVAISQDQSVCIVLYEYGKYKLNGDGRYHELKIKSDDGAIHSVNISVSFMMLSPDWHDSNPTLKQLLKANNKLKFYYRDKTSSYNWEIDCVGFTKMYEAMVNKP